MIAESYSDVSTHSRPKAAGIVTFLIGAAKQVSTHSRPKAAGLALTLYEEPSVGFNSQPPEGGWLEPVARAVYIIETGRDVEETGMIEHPTIAMSGASPDGLVGSDGLIEIKCPNTATHLEFVCTNEPKPAYMLQMLWQMACTGRQWCDFVSYDDRLPEHLAYRCIRIERDNDKIAEIEAEVIAFLAELNES